jgi:hypothetical protein
MASRPLNLLIYYGYLNCFNSSVNQWNNEKVAIDMAKYDILVFGDGVANPNHADYINASVIIPRLFNIKSDIKIFGYVSANQNINDFKLKVDQWDNLHVTGIFIDEAGYDFGVTRDQLNERIAYIRGKSYSNICFVNAWNENHIIGVENDPSYPNNIYNPSLNNSLLGKKDYYLLESFVVNTLSYSNSYASQSDIMFRGQRAVTLENLYGLKYMSVNIINNDNPNGQQLFNFAYYVSLAYNVEGIGSSDIYYGASSASVKFWNRPSPKTIGSTSKVIVTTDNNDNNICYRYGDFSILTLNFSTHNASISTY